MYANIISKIAKKKGCLAAFIYGSHANGNANKKSDLDVGMYFPKNISQIKYKIPMGNSHIDLNVFGKYADKLQLRKLFGEKIIPLKNEKLLRNLEMLIKKDIVNETCRRICNAYYPKKVMLDLKALLVYYYLKVKFNEEIGGIYKICKRKMNNEFFNMLACEYSNIVEPVKKKMYGLKIKDDYLILIPKKKEKNKSFIKSACKSAINKLTNFSKTQWQYAPEAILGLLIRKNYLLEKRGASVVKLESRLRK